MLRELAWTEVKRHISSKQTDLSKYEAALNLTSNSILKSQEKKWKLKFKNREPTFVQVFNSALGSNKRLVS